MQPLSTLALTLEATARVLEKYQLDAASLFAAAGLDPEPYLNADARIPAAKLARIWDECERLTGNPCIGFKVGQHVTAGNLHAVGFGLLASRTLAEALRRLLRHQRLITTIGRSTLETHSVELQMVVDPGARAPQQGLDALMTAVVALTRQIAYEDFTPLRVEMTRRRPPCAKQLARYFGCPVVYGAQRTLIAWRRSQVEKFLPRQNPAVAQACDEVASQYIANMDRYDIVSRTRAAIIELLAGGEPTRAAVADHLHMSERTLARRLGLSQTTFRALLDEIRQDLGLGYMQQGRYSVIDVTYLLGFSDQSNFARAFSRWTGMSPTEYRKQLKQEQSVGRLGREEAGVAGRVEAHTEVAEI